MNKLLLGQNETSKIGAAQTGMRLRSFVNVQPGMENEVEAPLSVLDTKSTEYVFGRLISRRALAVQITVKNTSPDYDLLISQISLLFCLEENKEPKDCQALSLSSMDKSVLQGLADRGQSMDPRNVVLRIIEGVGAAAVPFPTFIHHIGSSYTPAVAAVNGPFTQGYKIIFPDYTVNQVVRLSNLAFTTNKIVGKGSAETMMAFLPLDVLFSKDERGKFRSDAHGIYVSLAKRSTVRVDAQFVTPVKTTTAKVTSVAFNLTAQRVEVSGNGFTESSKVMVDSKPVPTAYWTQGLIWGMLSGGQVRDQGQTVIKVQMSDGSLTPECKVTVSSTSQVCGSQ